MRESCSQSAIRKSFDCENKLSAKVVPFNDTTKSKVNRKGTKRYRRENR